VRDGVREGWGGREGVIKVLEEGGGMVLGRRRETVCVCVCVYVCVSVSVSVCVCLCSCMCLADNNVKWLEKLMHRRRHGRVRHCVRVFAGLVKLMTSQQ
jgi:hypothetical protein